MIKKIGVLFIVYVVSTFGQKNCDLPRNTPIYVPMEGSLCMAIENQIIIQKVPGVDLVRVKDNAYLYFVCDLHYEDARGGFGETGNRSSMTGNIQIRKVENDEIVYAGWANDRKQFSWHNNGISAVSIRIVKGFKSKMKKDIQKWCKSQKRKKAR